METITLKYNKKSEAGKALEAMQKDRMIYSKNENIVKLARGHYDDK